VQFNTWQNVWQKGYSEKAVKSGLKHKAAAGVSAHNQAESSHADRQIPECLLRESHHPSTR